MTNLELANKLKDVALNYKTSYMLGAWGHFTNTDLINQSVSRTDVKNSPYKQGALSIKDQGWMFDCVCLIKAILWGWTGDKSKPRGGGAKYASNGVPDIGADTMITKCSGISTDFSNIEIGEAVWVKGHIGVYVGDNQVVECTPRWSVCPGVKITNLGNRGATASPSRKWTKHGKLPYITYVKETKPVINKPVEKLNTYEQWAVDKGLFAGYSDGLFHFDNPITRGQVCIVLYRLWKLLGRD